MEKRFYLNKSQGKLMGVAAGLGTMTGTDPLLFRLGLILAVLATGPVAVVLYIAAGLLAAERP